MALTDKAILISLSLGKFGTSREHRQASAELARLKRANPDLVKATTKLLPEGALKEINSSHREIRDFYHKMTLAWADEGSRMLPSKDFMEFSDQMRGFDTELNARVDRFCDRYNGYVEQMRRPMPDGLGDLFDPKWYPSDWLVRNKFKFVWGASPIPTVEDFRLSVPSEELEAMKSSLESTVDVAVKNAQIDLARRLAKPLVKMSERLSNPDNKFKDSLVGNLKAVLQVVPQLNLTDCPEFVEIANNLTSKVAIYSPDRLREDPVIRNAVANRVDDTLDRLTSVFGDFRHGDDE